ncbi:DDE superfamily endonuclease [Popillia japonica]|uniref:DDE superfamily endonuclease n=1 Tax=Popillia japonica TaxID=7064 RepID=A0AAW1KR54_POPJA
MDNGDLAIPSPDILAGTTTRLPYLLIADEAYPLKTKIMRPFSSSNLDIRSEYFNKRPLRARKCIECACGILYTQWRILGKALETNEEYACLIIKTACVLYNVLRDFEGNVTDECNVDTNLG